MASPSLREILIGGYAFFIPSGESVDGQTVSSVIKPDVSPATNWTAYSLGNILDFYQDTEESDQSFLAVTPNGGYAKRERGYVIADHYHLKTRQVSEPVWRLSKGFTAKIDEGTAQTPGAAVLRFLTGWLRVQGRQLGGYDQFIEDWWCEMRLKEPLKYSPAVSAPSLRFTLSQSVGGNSSNFPVPS